MMLQPERESLKTDNKGTKTQMVQRCSKML